MYIFKKRCIEGKRKSSRSKLFIELPQLSIYKATEGRNFLKNRLFWVNTTNLGELFKSSYQ